MSKLSCHQVSLYIFRGDTLNILIACTTCNLRLFNFICEASNHNIHYLKVLYLEVSDFKRLSRLLSINCHVNVLSRQHEILFSLLMPFSQQTARSPAQPENSPARLCVFLYQEKEGRDSESMERKKVNSPSEFTNVQRRLLTVCSAQWS